MSKTFSTQDIAAMKARAESRYLAAQEASAEAAARDDQERTAESHAAYIAAADAAQAAYEACEQL